MAERYYTDESIEYYSKKCCERQTLITQDNYFNEVTFTCNICNESVKSAMFLNCLHSFCAACVDEKLKAEYIVDGEYYTSELCIGQSHLTCPLCPDYDNVSVKLHSNPLPQLITSLIAIRCKVQNDEVLECQDCVFGAGGKPAVSYCLDCQAMICEIDLNSHKKYTVGHTILDLQHLRNFTVQQMLEYLQIITLTNFPTITEVVPQYLNGTECIKEASDKIAQLEASKLKLENEWDSHARQVVTFFEDLQKEIEQRRATLLQELSDLYQELMSPLEKCIQHLEQTISYTQYIAALKNYDYITGLQGTTDYKLSDISDTVVNFKLPPPSYTLQLNQQGIPTVTNTVNTFITIAKVNQTEATVKEIPLFKKRRFHAMTLNKYITIEKAITPVAVTIDNSATNIFYILFDSYIKHYQLVHTSLILKQTIKLGGHTADISHSAMTVTADNIVILISNQFYFYSKKDGQYKSQLTTTNYGYNFTYPKMYYFPGIPHYFYTSTLVSQVIYLVNTANGANQGIINFSQNIYQTFGNNGIISLIDIALCPIDVKQIVILCSCLQNLSTTLNHDQQAIYYIQQYQHATLYRVASLNQQLSPFCCFIPRKDELYLLDASTGQTSVFDPQNYVYRHLSTLNKIRTEESSFNKATDLEGKLTKDYPVQAFSAEQKIILFCGGNIQIIM